MFLFLPLSSSFYFSSFFIFYFLVLLLQSSKNIFSFFYHFSSCFQSDSFPRHTLSTWIFECQKSQKISSLAFLLCAYLRCLVLHFKHFFLSFFTCKLLFATLCCSAFPFRSCAPFPFDTLHSTSLAMTFFVFFTFTCYSSLVYLPPSSSLPLHFFSLFIISFTPPSYLPVSVSLNCSPFLDFYFCPSLLSHLQYLPLFPYISFS